MADRVPQTPAAEEAPWDRFLPPLVRLTGLSPRCGGVSGWAPLTLPRTLSRPRSVCASASGRGAAWLWNAQVNDTCARGGLLSADPRELPRLSP